MKTLSETAGLQQPLGPSFGETAPLDTGPQQTAMPSGSGGEASAKLKKGQKASEVSSSAGTGPNLTNQTTAFCPEKAQLRFY